MNFKNTKQKGSYALAQCIAKLYSLGHEVLLPVGDRQPYDLVFDDGKHLYKVQVKYAGLYKNGQCKVGLRITGGNQSYNYAKKYRDNDFDYLYVCTSSFKQYLIKWAETKNRNEITIEDPKYKKYLV